MAQMEAGMQSMLPVSLVRVGEGEKEEQNNKIAQSENAINQNFSSLALELEAIKEYLAANG